MRGRKKQKKAGLDLPMAKDLDKATDVTDFLAAKLSEKYGSGVISKLGDFSSSSEVAQGVSSQSLSLDIALGRPGLPAGRIVEIFGGESVGKSLLGIHFLAETQKMGGISILCDSERSVDLRFMRRVGLVFPSPTVILLQPPNMESSFELIEESIHVIRRQYSDCLITVIYDSVTTCPTKKELEEGYDDQTPALRARCMSKGLCKLNPAVSQGHVLLVFINQIRNKIGVYGNSEQSTGGNALRFYASVRIRMKQVGVMKLGKDQPPVGIESEVTIVKSKISSPYGRARMFLRFEKGLDKARDLLQAAVLLDEITEKAGYYYLRGEEKRFSRGAFPLILKEQLGGWEKYKAALTHTAIARGLLAPYGQMAEEESTRGTPDREEPEESEEIKD